MILVSFRLSGISYTLPLIEGGFAYSRGTLFSWEELLIEPFRYWDARRMKIYTSGYGIIDLVKMDFFKKN